MTVYNWLDRKYSSHILSKAKHDIFHATYYDDYFLHLKKRPPFVITVHDMIHELYPGLWSNQEEITAQKKKVIHQAAGIIAVSENTKKDLLRIYPSVDPNKVSVVHHGHSLSTQTAPFPSINPSSYVLYVGLREHYKNFDRLLLSLQSVFKEHPHLQLICAGGGAFNEKEVQEIHRLKLGNKVTYMSFSSDEHLCSLYKNATLFVYPSLYEGFGIPILEAFGAGCPVVLSRSSCFPEVAGEAAAYFNGESAEDMAQVLTQLLSRKEDLQHLRQLGYEKVKEYTWASTAQRTEDFYQRILGQ